MGHVVYGAQLGGLPSEAVYALDDPALADPKKRAVFAYARKMVACPSAVRRADVDALRPHLTDAQIVELTLFVSRFNTMNLLAEAWGVPLERENLWKPKAPPAAPKSKAEGQAAP
jgi:alkylhydroperoxidase family enzyme